MTYFLICWLLTANIAAAVLTVYDKFAAKTNRRRIPEKTLLLWAALGGSPAEYLTMYLIRHKTRHRKFMVGIPVIFALQLLAAGVVFFAFIR